MNKYIALIALLYYMSVRGADLVLMQNQLQNLSSMYKLKELDPLFLGGGYVSVKWCPYRGEPWIAAISGIVNETTHQFHAVEAALGVVSNNQVDWFTLVKHDKPGSGGIINPLAQYKDFAQIDTGDYLSTMVSWDPEGGFLAINSGAGRYDPIIAMIKKERAQDKFPQVDFLKIIMTDEQMRRTYARPFVPRFWLKFPTRVCDGFHCYRAEAEWTRWLLSEFKLPFAQEKGTVIKYLQYDNRKIFGIVLKYKTSAPTITFDLVVIDTGAWATQKHITDERDMKIVMHNLSQGKGIIFADVYRYDESRYIVAYVPKVDLLNTVYFQAIDDSGALGKSALLSVESPITAIAWDREFFTRGIGNGMRIILVAEYDGQRATIGAYEVRSQQGSALIASYAFAENMKGRVIFMEVCPTKPYLSVLFEDGSLGIYKMPHLAAEMIKGPSVWD